MKMTPLAFFLFDTIVMLSSGPLEPLFPRIYAEKKTGNFKKLLGKLGELYYYRNYYSTISIGFDLCFQIQRHSIANNVHI